MTDERERMTKAIEERGGVRPATPKERIFTFGGEKVLARFYWVGGIHSLNERWKAITGGDLDEVDLKEWPADKTIRSPDFTAWRIAGWILLMDHDGTRAFIYGQLRDVEEPAEPYVQPPGADSGFDRFLAVRLFHEQIGASVGKRVADLSPEEVESFELAKWTFMRMSVEQMQRFRKHGGDGHLRMHLIFEEVGEWCDAMAQRDEVKAMDALTDLEYVTVGTGITYDLPVHHAFREVHRSNMTKQPQASDPDKARVRDKGPGYQPPRLEEVLAAWRARDWNHKGTVTGRFSSDKSNVTELPKQG